MADQRKGGISWTDETWNFLRGCRRKSTGCLNCYAEDIAARFSGPGLPYEGLVDRHGRWNGAIRVVEEKIDDPLRWKRPRRIFVNSMSDLFHEDVPTEVIDRAVRVMAQAGHHVYQSLTKRAGRQLEYLSDPGLRRRVFGPLDGEDEVWPLPNWHVGVSIENREALEERAPLLAQTPAAVRWWSAEPLLGALGDLEDYVAPGHESNGPAGWVGDPRGVDWIVVGGESGEDARPMHPEWAREIRDQAVSAGVAFHFKQWGAWAPISGSDLDHDALYRSNVVARRGGDQGVLDELHGRYCTVESLILRTDGEHKPIGHPEAFRSDLPGWPSMQAFRVGKAKAGRSFDGRVWEQYPGDVEAELDAEIDRLLFEQDSAEQRR